MANLLQELKESVIEGNAEQAVMLTEQCLQAKIGAQEIFREAIVAGIHEAGVLWDCNRYRVPDVILSADAFNSAVAVIEKQLHPGESDMRPKVMLGVVEGDVHDLGKNIVIAMLRGAGLRVMDLGVDVPAEQFVAAVREECPDVLGIGAYMSSTMLEIPEVIRALAGLRSQIKIVVGGVVISQAFCEQVGADGWAPDASTAVEMIASVLRQDSKRG